MPQFLQLKGGLGDSDSALCNRSGSKRDQCIVLFNRTVTLSLIALWNISDQNININLIIYMKGIVECPKWGTLIESLELL